LLERKHSRQARNAQIVRQLSRRRQPRPWRNYTIQNRPSHALVYLQLQRLALAGIDPNEHGTLVTIRNKCSIASGLKPSY
jgi:hypothetical protein